MPGDKLIGSQSKNQPICQDLTLADGLQLLQSKSSLLCPTSLLGSTVKGHRAGLPKLTPFSLSENLIQFVCVCAGVGISVPAHVEARS